MTEVGSLKQVRPAGDSSEQRAAEKVMIAALAEELSVSLDRTRTNLADGGWVEFDGATDDLSVIVEAWAHQGRPKSAQVAKIAKDTLKLALAARQIPENRRRILLFSDEEAAKPFLGNSWQACAIREFGVEIIVRPLPPELRERVQEAQRRQYR